MLRERLVVGARELGLAVISTNMLILDAYTRLALKGTGEAMGDSLVASTTMVHANWCWHVAKCNG